MATKSTFVPMPELTPDASPRSGSPVSTLPLRPHRRYGPQLADNTSRRARRDGDKPSDVVTPYTRHHKHSSSSGKSKRRAVPGPNYHRRPRPLAALDDHESEDDFLLLELAARRAERQLHDAALAFPNGNSRRPREGVAAEAYFRDSDDGETTAEESRSPLLLAPRQVGGAGPGSSYARRRVRNGGAERLRRRSTDLGWWHKVMQEHAEQKVREWRQSQRYRYNDNNYNKEGGELDGTRDVESEPESDWFREKMVSDEDNDDDNDDEDEVRGPANVDPRPSPPPDDDVSRPHLVAPVPVRPSPQKRKMMKKQKIVCVVNDSDDEGGFDMEFDVMRRAASPPLLGDDIVFPRCESPEVCKLSTDLPYTLRALEEQRRDPTQKCGLWGGYCYDNSNSTARRDTGNITATAAAAATATTVASASEFTPDPSSYLSIVSRQRRTPDHEPPALSPPPTPVTGGLWGSFAKPSATSHRAPPTPSTSPPQGSGLSPFQSLGICPSSGPSLPLCSRSNSNKLSPEEKEARIAAEFDDAFITQVYNYLTLGYPASARAFDEELCTATAQLSVEDMRRDDEAALARGLVWDDDVGKVPEQQRCARWKALKAYVLGWARGLEDLDELSPGVWGVGQLS